MQFDSLMDFLTMGQHGLYVWSAYGIWFVTILGLIFHSLHQKKQLKKIIKQKHCE